MSCINTGSPQYKKLLKLAESVNRNSLDLYVDVTRFNKYFNTFPESIEDLDNGLEFIKAGDFLSEDIAALILLNTPSIERVKANKYEFKVVNADSKLNTTGKLYETAKRLETKINDKFVVPGQKNIARVTDASGIVSLIIEPNLSAINNYKNNINKQREAIRLEFEEETRVSEDMYDTSYYEAIEDFDRLVESGEITQFCSR